MHPRFRQLLLFWLLLSAASVFFAEVISGASPFAFFTGWGLLVVLPLYGLHTLLLAALAYRHGAPRFATLFFAGLLFGLYEAYITKVLWAPPWFESVNIAGVDLLAFTMLVPYWHTFMSFIIPLLVIETVGTSSNSVIANLPRRAKAWLARPRFVYAVAIWFGLLQTASQTQPGLAFLSAVMNLAVVAFLLWLWKRSAARRFSLGVLLPRRGAFIIMLALLAPMYLVQGIFLLPEKLPGLGEQATIWLIYVLVILAFLRARRQPGVQAAPAAPLLFTQPPATSLVVAYLAAALLGGFLPHDLGGIWFLVNAIFGSLFGLVALVYSIRQLRQA